MPIKIHLATSRKIGEVCIDWLKKNTNYELVSMDECDVFISVLYDQLISKEYIAKHRCFNFHPGVLPWYRGSGAFSWAIINGEIETGVTLHEIDEDIDHGNVIDIRRFPILPEDTAEDLFLKAEKLILYMFKLWLDNLVLNNYKTIQQVEGRVYLRKHLELAKDLTRHVRAFTFEGKENAFYFNNKGEKIYLKL